MSVMYSILLIGVGLSMDAVAVSMTNGMVYRNLRKRTYIAMPVAFGFFQALMPVLGYFGGSLFAEAMEKFSNIVIFLILGVIGLNMVREGIKDFRSKSEVANKEMSFKTLLFQAVATSIDAFAVGVGFSAAKTDIFTAAILIGCTTFVLVIGAIIVGRKFGDMLGCKAEMLGGAILIAIGIKAIL